MRVSSYLALVVIAFPVIVIIAHEGPVWSGHPLSHHSPRIGHHSLHKHGDGHAHNRNLERDYWGNRGGGDSGYGRAWNDAEAEHASHEHDSHLHDRGGSGWANGHEGEHHHEDVGHRHKVKGGGAKSADDAGGTRKYSYFTEGNGPDGLYRRGYYGSDDYDHEASKSAKNHRGAGEGHKNSDHGAHNSHAHANKEHDHGEAHHTLTIEEIDTLLHT